VAKKKSKGRKGGKKKQAESKAAEAAVEEKSADELEQSKLKLVEEPAVEPAQEKSEEKAEGKMVPASELEKAQKERDEYLELSQRTRADLENYRKRVSREKESDKIQTIGNLLRELIAPVDDLNRAVEEAEKNPCFDTLFGGLKIVRDHLWKALKTTEFEKIDAETGNDFDPNFHEAMMQIPHPELPANKIVEEFAAGYKIGDFVLRPSKVGVSAGAPAPVEEKTEETETKAE
jgi:molecular chaperone GrpE